MVKGTTRRVIVVKTPDPRYFEEAIFIVKEDVSMRDGIDADQLLREAQDVASGYIKTHVKGGKSLLAKIPPLGYLAAGALLSGAVYLITGILL